MCRIIYIICVRTSVLIKSAFKRVRKVHIFGVWKAYFLPLVRYIKSQVGELRSTTVITGPDLIFVAEIRNSLFDSKY